ncbi:hypothetical protein C1645_845918 [Glomus cerebriforme]|uniref:F-box domain-containing protein n=1 Tax=Glomus cerebriforme TaxID=658196 RepID=A0A397T5Z2_9GLOM|nr:hypothetical protein C1645_845918 [Glomus cerebriforme]
MFMNQITSLKRLTYTDNIINRNLDDLSFTCFLGTKDYLTDLLELHCSSNLPSKFFYQLSQMCHNLQSLTIDIKCEASNELKELISLQNNLKDLILSDTILDNWIGIIPCLTKHSNTLTRLHLHGNNNKKLSLLFVASFTNLQEIEFSFHYDKNFEDFEKLQYVTFPKLQILNFPHQCPKPEYMIKFLEINGNNLETLNIGTYRMSDALDLSIVKYCPNIKEFSKIFNNNEIDALKIIFESCQYLESIKLWCGKEWYLNEKETLEIVAKYSQKHFYKLKIYNTINSELLPEDLESFFISWKNRPSKKLLTLIIIKCFYSNYAVSEKNMEIIEKYKNLGIIKKFEVEDFRW